MFFEVFEVVFMPILFFGSGGMIKQSGFCLLSISTSFSVNLVPLSDNKLNYDEKHVSDYC